MISIRLIAVGNLKERYLTDAVAEYAKRLSKYCKLEIIEVKENKPIQDKIKGYSILCDIEGDLITSEALANKFKTISQTSSLITFVIGGSEGVSGLEVNEKISFGRITFPHQLFRVVLIEQIYRAFTIIKGEKYHK